MNIEQDILDHELEKLRRVAWKMDALFYIPGTNFSVGLDNIFGLIPVVGDVASLAPSIWLIHRSYKLGATPGAIAYMICNLLMDLTVGSVPIVGDIFDVVYNSNIRNYRLLEKNLNKKAARAKTVRTAHKIDVIDAYPV